jgi:predicted dehydrogenase
MADKVRVGLIGANVDNTSWGARTHLPALQSLPEFEVKAVCTAHAETAAATAKAFGVDLAFHDYNTMFEHPEVDLVSVVVRVPYHYEIVMAALRAGKPVFCEWPLAATVRQAEEMTELAAERSLFNMVGLQGRSDPTLNYLRELIREGFVGEVLACSMISFSGGALELINERAWRGTRSNGAHTLSITTGHSVDALCYCLGEFVELSARVATKIQQIRVRDTGQEIEITSPDNVLVSGVLESGALASVHVASVPFNGSGWRLEIYGREGTIYATSPGQAHTGPNRLVGAKAGEQMAELPVPDRFVLVPEGTPRGAPFNVAQEYVRLSDAWRQGTAATPGFAAALQRHRLLDTMQRSSDEGRTLRA